MYRYLIAVISLAALLGSAWARDCPCSKPTLCNRVQYDKKEVHGIVLKSDEKVWQQFNWTKLTTISLVDFFNDTILCHAHEHSVRVLTRETFPLEKVNNASYVNQWLENKLKFAQNNFVDGINLFVDDPVPKGHPLVGQLTQFVQLVTKAFHEKVPGSLVVFSAPYSPYSEQKNGVDGKNYDFLAISKAVDQFFIMAFGQRKQSAKFENRCLAGPTSNFYLTMGGILAYQNLSLSMDKLILGVPYFGLEYKCLDYAEDVRCYIEAKSYRGSSCSSNVANLVPWNEHSRYASNGNGEFWDEHSSSYIFNYVSQPYGYLRQIWYDRNDTITLKFHLAEENHLRGVGIWALNYLDHGSWAYIPKNKNKPLH